MASGNFDFKIDIRDREDTPFLAEDQRAVRQGSVEETDRKLSALKESLIHPVGTPVKGSRKIQASCLTRRSSDKSSTMQPAQGAPEVAKASGPAASPKDIDPPPAKNSNKQASASFTPHNWATLPLTSRTFANPKASPQSYDWRAFMANQIDFMTTCDLGGSLGVLAEDYVRVYSASKQDPKICSNFPTLVSSRFLPAEAKPSDLEIERAKRDGSLVNNSWKDSTVGQFVESTSTYSGKLSLLLKAANPTSNSELIQMRSEAVDALLQSEKLRNDIAKNLKQYSANEVRLLNQFDPKGPGTKKPGRLEVILKPPIFESYIPKKWADSFRRSTKLVTLNDIYKTSYDLFTAGSKMAVGAFTVCYAAANFFGFSTESMENYKGLAAGAGGGILTASQLVDSKALAMLATPLMAPELVSNGLTSSGYTWAEYKVKEAMQGVMVDVAAAIRAMKQVYEIVQKSGYGEHLEHFDKLKNLMESQEPEVQAMLETMHSKTLDSKSALFSAGAVLCGWDMIQADAESVRSKAEKEIKAVDAEIETAKQALEAADTNDAAVAAKAAIKKAEGKKKKLLERIPEVKRLILEAMVALGEIDGNVTLAEKVLQSTARAPLSILGAVQGQSKELKFHLKDSHFPPAASSLSSIELQPITIITGENGAGKTTFALNWINNALLRQTMGLAFCDQSSTLPIYDRVISSRGITDSNSKSSFEATDEFVKDICEELANNPDKKFFLLLDELYKDTDAQKGAAKLEAFLNFLENQHRQNGNITAVFITHSKEFAHAEHASTEKLTTTKDKNGKPSGILKSGVYTFESDS